MVYTQSHLRAALVCMTSLMIFLPLKSVTSLRPLLTLSHHLSKSTPRRFPSTAAPVRLPTKNSFSVYSSWSTRSSSSSTRLFSTMSKGGAIVRKDDKIGVKQLFDEESSTYTYLLYDQESKDAILFDPVDIQVDRDLEAAKELGLNLVYGVNRYVSYLHSSAFAFFSSPLLASLSHQT